MGLTVGPAQWHPTYIGSLPLGTFTCGGYLFSKGDGVAWIVAPYTTQVMDYWNNGAYNTGCNLFCASAWAPLNTALISAGLTPSEWFVPSSTTLSTIGFPCRAFWGPSPCYDSNQFYWSSTEIGSGDACGVYFEAGQTNSRSKNDCLRVRAFRCVTY